MLAWCLSLPTYKPWLCTDLITAAPCSISVMWIFLSLLNCKLQERFLIKQRWNGFSWRYKDRSQLHLIFSELGIHLKISWKSIGRAWLEKTLMGVNEPGQCCSAQLSRVIRRLEKGENTRLGCGRLPSLALLCLCPASSTSKQPGAKIWLRGILQSHFFLRHSSRRGHRAQIWISELKNVRRK